MGAIDGGLEGGILIAGETYGPVFIPQNDQHMVIKADFAKVYHTGNDSDIRTDVDRLAEEVGSENLFEPCTEIQLVTGGEFVHITDAGCQSKLIGLGNETTVDYHLYADNLHDEAKIMSENLAFMAGDNSRLTVSEFSFKDSIAISLGERSDLTLIESSNIEGDYTNNIAFSVGKESFIEIGNESIAVSLGKDSNVIVGNDSVVLSSENSTVFTLGEGSCASIAWHDGTRKRVKVVYEGEDGIQAGMSYKVDQNGNVIAA